MVRKVISNIVLTIIQPTVQEYLSHSQSAYRHGRSTSDIVWCHRFLAARFQKFQDESMITGIDMTLAFVIVKRTKLIEIPESFLQEGYLEYSEYYIIILSEYSSVTQH